MPLRTRSAVLALLLAPIAALWLLPSAAQAAPRTPDPERVVVPAPRSAPADRAAADVTYPATIDSDVYASVAAPTTRAYFVAAGHLKLRLRSGSTTRYTGSFTDYAGGRTTKASADTSQPDAPRVSIKTRNGSFTFRPSASFGATLWTGAGVKAPKKTGFKAGDVFLVGATHVLKTVTYPLVLSERVGPVSKPFEYSGSITLAYDGNQRVSGGSVSVTDAKGRVVTKPIRGTGFVSPGSFFYTVATVDRTTMGISANIRAGLLDGYAVSGSGSKIAQWVVSGTV